MGKTNRQQIKERNILSAQDISFFCLQLSQMAGAGIPLAEGLDAMLEDAGGPLERTILLGLQGRLGERMPFSQALTEAGCFPEYMVHMVKIGEDTGSLDWILLELSDYYRREWETRQAVAGAITYPVVLILVMLAVLFLMTVFVMPVFEGVFRQLGTGFTPTAQAIIRGVAWGSGILLGIFAAGLLIFGICWLAGWREPLGKLWVKLISNRRLTGILDLERLSSLLSLSLSLGGTVDEGLEWAIPLLRSDTIREKSDNCLKRLRAGDELAFALRETSLFSAMHRQMLRVGSQTGRLDEAMKRVAGECGQQAEERISQIIGRLEPVLVGLLSLVAGGILLLVMLPLLGVLTALG